MRTGLTISATAHAMLFAWSLISFSNPKPLEHMTEAMPVDVITDEQFSQLRAGAKEAAKTEVQKPVVDKVEAPKPAPTQDPNVRVAEQEVRAAAATPPPPAPEPRPIDQRTPPPVPTRAPEPRPPEPAKPEPPKPDPIAEALKREPPKPEQQRPEPPKPEPPSVQPPRRPQPQVAQQQPPRPQQQATEQSRFNANQIAALLDRREQTRTASTGAEVNRTAALGTATGNAARLTQSEIDALRAQIQACWNPPVGSQDASSLIVRVKILLNQDGSLSSEPVLMNRGGSPTFQIAAESAMRAVRRCAPYRLPAAKYDSWRDVEITFDPRDMLRG
jgi:colicin import membrane protein